MSAPPPSQLDFEQILPAVYNDNGKLRVDAEVTATIVGPQEVIISDVDDSIKIGNGSSVFAQVTGANALKVDGSAVTQPVSASSLPLPTGASTATKQDTGNTSLASIDSKITTVNTNAVTISTALPTGANTIGTVAATQSGMWNVNNISGTISLPTGASTSALQTTGNSSLSSIDTKTPSLVSGSQPIVGLARTLEVSGTATDINQDLFSLDATGYTVAYVQVTAIGGGSGSFAGNFQCSNDNSIWINVFPSKQELNDINSLTGFVIFSQNGGAIDPTLFRVPILGKYLRLRVTFNSGTGNSTTAYAQLRAVDHSQSIQVCETVIRGNTGGTVSLGQDLMSGSLAVAIASDQTSIPASQSGTWNINNVSGTVSLPTGASTSALQTQPGVDIGDVTINNATGASAVNIQDGGNSITVDGTITSTIAAGPTTIAKAEDSASADADVGVPAMAIRKATPVNTSGTDGDYEMLQMSVGRLWTSSTIDAALPTGSNAIGKLASNDGVDVGDVTINNASGASAVNIQDGGNSITVDGTIAATQSGTWSVRTQDGSGNLLSSTTNALDVNLKTSSITLPISAASLPLPTLASTSTKQSDGSQKTQIVDGSGNVIDSTSNALNVSAVQSGTWNITNVSGTVSLPTGASTEVTLAKLAQAQSSTTSSQSGTLVQGAVTTTAPTYITAQTNPLSLNTSGGLRVDGSGVTQPISAASLPLPTGAATDASITNVQGSVTGGTAATKSSLIGAIFNQPAPLLNVGQQASLQTDAYANLLVANPNLNIHTELLQELILETRAMRMALVALVTEGQRVRADDFNPHENDFSSAGYIN